MNLWLVLILTSSALALILIIAKSFSLYFLRSELIPGPAQAVKSALQDGRKVHALTMTENIKDSFFRSFLELSITGSQKSSQQLQEAMTKEIIKECELISSKLDFIPFLGNAAAFFALIGTFTGMIKAFAATQMADQPSKALALTQSISDIMPLIGYSFLSIIITSLAYSILSNRANVLTEKLSGFSLEIYQELIE